MKAKVLVLITLGFCLCVSARAASISTTDGETYNNITKQRVDPDGLYIEYKLPAGGLGMSKVKFSRLSPELQKQYGYDATKAHDYETKVAKATEDFRQESLRDEQIAQAARQARAAREESTPVYHVPPPAQVSGDQAAPTEVPPYGYGYDYSYGGVGAFAVPNTGHVPSARRDYAPVVRPIPFPTLNTPRQPPPARVQVAPARSSVSH